MTIFQKILSGHNFANAVCTMTGQFYFMYTAKYHYSNTTVSLEQNAIAFSMLSINKSLGILAIKL